MTDTVQPQRAFSEGISASCRVPEHAEYWLALPRLPGIGRATFLRLLQAYRTPQAAWGASDAEWRNAKLVRAGVSTDPHRDAALRWATDQVRLLEASPWSLCVYGGDHYPPALASLHDPPPYLFVRGQIPDSPAVAIVGSRQSTAYGLEATERIASDLAANGVCIVSGFARGIDTAAHKAALDAGGTTIAVWGCGPDVIYPRENKALVDRIAEHGAIVTEFSFGAAPEARNFPVRNRVIAGLSSGVLVAQAQSRSGALLTAQHALEQGKEVYAIPGEIGRAHSAGANELLKSGAKLVTSADDILSDLGIRASASRSATPRTRVAPMPPLTPVETRLWAGLGGSPCHLDRLAVSLNMSAAECAAVLVTLQLKGVVKQEAGNMFSRIV
jgi:DNA processing protein